MKNKNLTILMAVFVVLAGFLAARTYWPRLTPEPSAYTQKVSSVNKTSIQSLSIKNKNETIDLQKDNNVWKINGKEADVTKIENLVNQLLTTTPPLLVAQTDKRYKEFELTDDLATKVTLDNKLTWLIGKSSGTAVYARFDGENDVYLIKDLSLTSLSSVSDWYDKTILTFDQTKATKITFKEGNTITIVAKEDDKWLSDTNVVNKDTIDSLLTQVSKLTAQSLFDPTEGETYPVTPALSITVEYDGNNESLEFFKGDSDYLVKRQSDGEQFIVAEYSTSSIISAPKELFKKGDENMESDTIN